MKLDYSTTLADAAVLASCGAQVLHISATQREARKALIEAAHFNLAACATRVIRANGHEAIRYPGGGQLRFASPAIADAWSRGRLLDAVSVPWALLPLLEDVALSMITTDGRVLCRKTERR